MSETSKTVPAVQPVSAVQPVEADHPATAAIAGMLGEFKQEAAATRAAVDDRLRVLRRIYIGLTAFVAVTAVLVALVLVILVQNRQTSAKTRAAIDTNSRLSAQIADCTSVGGTCYEQSQANLRKTIALLVESNKAIAKCARVTTDDDEFDTCVTAKLKAVTH
jgi:hypothetical protein